jgi:hypothetical protein
MKYYCDDDYELYVGVYACDTTEEKIIKKLAKVLGLEFIEADSEPSEISDCENLDFNQDTIIVKSKDFNEDFAELFDRGVAVYLIP